MNLEFVPLLQVQRDLYRMPRGMERFHHYLQTLMDPETKELTGLSERAGFALALRDARTKMSGK
jgi:hypothetical protein